MTDHADTIRRAIDRDTSKPVWDDAVAALDALLAERQQAIDDAEKWEARYWERDAKLGQLMTDLDEVQQAVAELEPVVATVRAERQQAIDARDATFASYNLACEEADKWQAEALRCGDSMAKVEARCEQAIDALREANEILQAEGYPPIRLSLGEQP